MSPDRLTGLDTSFLHLERDGAHMHVAATMIFDGAAPDFGDFKEHLRSRLHLVPRFRQKLRFVPLDQGRPVWVDDPHLNLDYHVRHTALPAPGSEEQLRTFAARVFSQELDRARPLWEMWVVDGLDGGRFAIVSKSHHCLVDGISGVDITTVLFDAEPEPAAAGNPPQWIPRPEPSPLQILGSALTERLTQPAEIVRGARALIRRPSRALAAVREAIGATGAIAGKGLAAPDSPLNVEIGPYRRFAWVRADLADLRRIKEVYGGTVNDVVLTVVAGAIGRHLRGRGQDTDRLVLKAMVPVSIRSTEQRGALGNQVTAMMAPLPVWCEDPIERLGVVRRSMGNLKRSKQAVGANLLAEMTDFAPPTVVSQAARLQSRQRFFNLVVTNVPGPQFPLYVLGHKLRDIFPMVPLAKRQAVCVGIMSYDGGINFGLIGDYEGMPGLATLADDLDEELASLAALAPRTAGNGAAPSERAGTATRS
ncbi:MAG: wax ester/triacylglycerol synthase family O-acyltransferase [Thermoleophilia bacterium]|nr:wax ester/triacylglycerol synthase family O-acyltransferase [Thermoleophilia bacterium]GIK78048.1 MAG: diacylglycerol O-acyltransferase [Actinomycetes bacterium]